MEKKIKECEKNIEMTWIYVREMGRKVNGIKDHGKRFVVFAVECIMDVPNAIYIV